jgi:hypothetical protein
MMALSPPRNERSTTRCIPWLGRISGAGPCCPSGSRHPRRYRWH